MNATLPPSRLRLWAARLLGGAGASLAAYASILATAGADRLPVYPLRLAVDAAALWLCGRRRFRFASALWFGCSAFLHLLANADRGRVGQEWGGVAAALLALATVPLMWPLLRAPSREAPLAPLSGAWALVATLLVATVDGVLLGLAGTGPRDAIFLSGATALGLFAGCMVASQVGPLRWLVQLLTIAVIGAAHASELRTFSGMSSGAEPPAMELARAVSWLGLATFALGLDWIRSGAAGRDRLLRALLLSLLASLPPLALAAAWTPLRAEAVAMAFARAAALGLAAAIMPRVAGRGRPVLLVRRPVGLPPRALAVIILLVAAGAAPLTGDAEAALAVGAALIPAGFCLVFRTRLTRAALFLNAGAPLLVASFAVQRSWRGAPLLSIACLLAIAAIGHFISGPRAGRHFPRRLRWASAPAPRASLALAGLSGLAILGWLGFSSVTRPETRSGLLAAAGGSVPLPAPLYFRPPRLRDAPAPGRLTGSAVAVDPLGRGTWVVDEERDEVALVGGDRKVKRFAVGQWPELLVVTREGRVFVSCRQAGRIDVIEPDLQRRSIPVDGEVRALALDPSERRLYAGLLTHRALESFDASTLEQVGRLELEQEPRSLAVNALGVAVLPDKGSQVVMASADLRRRWSVPLPGGDGVAWHGQGLLPAGRDLVVLHAQVNTGLERPVSGGGYGGAVSQPILLVATVVEGGRPPLTPPNARHLVDALDVADVSGAALSRGALYVASRITGAVERVPLGAGARRGGEEREVRAVVASGNGMTGVAVDGDRLHAYAAFDRVLVSARTAAVAEASQSVANLGGGRMDAELARGRRLFFRNDRVISEGGLACASCHPDGREDGLVWRLQGARLQTPSLAGRLSDTGPFNWHGTTKTLPENVEQTITRLGGTGLSREDAAALARYLREGLRPVRPTPAGDPVLVARGRDLFHDGAVGCSSCHDPASGYTDGQRHDVESLSAKEREELKQALGQEPDALAAAFDTPTLRHLGLTAPYFHDGSAPTLEALVDGNQDRMGKTSHLSAGDRRALVAYLRTL